MANGDPTKVKVGAGKLYFGTANATAPTDLTTPWATVDASWTAVGYTNSGHDATISPKFDPIEVAEELVPLDYVESNREIVVAFDVAQITSTNIAKILNGGTIATVGGNKTYTPPAVGSVTKVAIGWEANDASERWVYYQCIQTGAAKITRDKAPNKALIPLSFNATTPPTGPTHFGVLSA